MKNIAQRIMIAVVAVAATQVAMAHSWRINNDASKGAHFASINEAMDTIAVADGDTLYLDPGCVLSDAQTITKAVTVIGTGWDFSDKPYVPARIANYLYINNAAKVMSVQIDKQVYPNHDNIVLERCRITGNIKKQETKYSDSNLQIIGCYVNGFVGGLNSNNYAVGWKIYNTYISYWEYYSRSIEYLTGAVIENCFLRRGGRYDAYNVIYNVNNSVVRNNIMISDGEDRYKNNIISGSNNVFYNNCLSADETFSLAENNVCANSIAFATFVCNTGTGGALMQLCEGSPAKGAGEGGIDCGPYAEGSLYPFVTYGLPEHIPYFTEADIPTQPTDGKVKVTLKIENQNR